jgi:hypothetical protein
MAFVKKIIELTERSDSIDAKKQIIKLNKDIKNYKEKVYFLKKMICCKFLIILIGSNAD